MEAPVFLAGSRSAAQGAMTVPLNTSILGRLPAMRGDSRPAAKNINPLREVSGVVPEYSDATPFVEAGLKRVDDLVQVRLLHPVSLGNPSKNEMETASLGSGRRLSQAFGLRR